MSKEQVLQRKKLLISKNNILVDTNEFQRAAIAAKALKREKEAQIKKKRPPMSKPITKYFGTTEPDI